MLLTTIRCVLFLLACHCASVFAQPTAAETLFCGSAERTGFAPIAGQGIAELRAFLFAKKQLDQLLKYLDSKEGGSKWTGATPDSRLRLMEAAARSAAVSSAAVTHLPFLPSTRYAFEGQFAPGCAKSAQLLDQMHSPGFARYQEVRARVAAAAPVWYASGLFARLDKSAAPALLQPLAVPAAEAPAAQVPAAQAPAAGPAKVVYYKGRPVQQKSTTPKPAPKPTAKAIAAERQRLLAKREADIDLVLREIGLFKVGMTAIESDVLRTGALASAAAVLIGEAADALTDAGLKSLFLDPTYLTFNHALMSTAHKAEPLLIQDYPHLEPLSRDVSQAWAADFLRPAPERLPAEQKPVAPPPAAPAAPAPSKP